MSTGPYRTAAPVPPMHDEMLRRETNEKLSAELVKLAETITKLYSEKMSASADAALDGYERMAAVLKSRGV